MAVDEIQNLILNVKGREEIEDLTRAIKLEEAVLSGLIATYGEHDAVTKASAKVVVDLNRQLKASEEQVKRTGAALDHSVRSIKGVSQAAVEFSRGIEDLATGGFLGVLNNIPRTFEGIGQAAGLSAAKIATLSTGISLAATGAFVLYKNWDSVTALFGKKTDEAIDGIERLKARIKELEDKPIKLAVDLHELDEAKRKLKELEANKRAFDAAGEGKTVEEKEAGDTFKRAFEGTGGEGARARDAVATRFRAEAEANNVALGEARKAVAEAEAKLEETRKIFKPGMGLKTIEIEAKKVAAAREKAIKIATEGVANANNAIGALFRGTEAGNDPNARAELARRFRQAGQDRFAEMAEAASPEAMKQKAREDAAIDNQKRMAKLDDDLKKKEAADFDRAADETYRQQMHAKQVKKEAEDFDRDALATYRQKMAGKAQPDIARQVKSEDESIAAGGYVPRAEQELAQLRAAGGAVDRFGRFQQMTPDQIDALVQRRVDAELQRRNPNMMGDQRRDIATKVTSMAGADLNQRMMGLSMSGLDNTGKLLGISAQLDGEMARMSGVVQAQGRSIARLQTRSRARARTALPRG